MSLAFKHFSICATVDLNFRVVGCINKILIETKCCFISSLKTHIHLKSEKMHATRHLHTWKHLIRLRNGTIVVLSFGWWLNWGRTSQKVMIHPPSNANGQSTQVPPRGKRGLLQYPLDSSQNHSRINALYPCIPLQNSSAAGFLSDHFKYFG